MLLEERLRSPFAKDANEIDDKKTLMREREDEDLKDGMACKLDLLSFPHIINFHIPTTV